MPQLFTVEETADRLKVSAKTIRRWIKAGTLVSHKIGNCRRVDASSVMRMLAASTAGSATVRPSGTSKQPTTLRQLGKSKVWTTTVSGRDVPLGTTDKAEAIERAQALLQGNASRTKSPWRTYPLPDRPGFGLKYYDREGVRRTHRIPPNEHIENIEDAERYAASWYDRNVGSPSGEHKASALASDITFEAFGNLWTTGALAKRFPDHVKVKRSAKADERRLALYVYPIVGAEPLSRFDGRAGLDLVEQVTAGLPPVGSSFSRASRRQILQAVHRLLVLATYPARLILANPLPKGFLPRASSNRAKSFLYPAEDRALLGCSEVPLIDRLFYGMLAREGLRSSELLNLEWADVDVERGVLALDQNKTSDPRSWSMDPGVVRALKIWKASFTGSPLPNSKIVTSKCGATIDPYAAASSLRAHLQIAGVERSQLFESNEQRIALRAHDLRATFVTVSLANGRTEAWVCDRTGHRSSQMLYSYRRTARTYAELNLGELTPLDQAIPEFRSNG